MKQGEKPCHQLMSIYYELTLSRLGPPLDRYLALAIHISPNNGPMDMIPSAKIVVDVLAIHWTL
jgi:hypothetical protein